MEQEIKRLFFAFEIHAPWPESLPPGRWIQEDLRHLTLSFLGNISFPELQKQLPSIPLPSFHIGKAGFFDRCLFLPLRYPHAVAWNIQWLDNKNSINLYQEELSQWLLLHNFIHKKNHRDFSAHVTLARPPFHPKEWTKSFSPLPLYADRLHLYESLGYSQYRSLWSFSLLPPFTEIEHTADIAFHVYGTTIQELYQHAELALCFQFPSLLPFRKPLENPTNLETVITQLNASIAHADAEIGCPFKGVSFHEKIEQTSQQIYKWEMIVDV